MGREAPDDDRVWLGRADLATRTGRFDEADGWLRRCEAPAARRPGRLASPARLGPGGRQLAEAERALAHLPAARIHARRGRRDPRPARRPGGRRRGRARALEARVELEPGDAAAWGRLADLAARGGQADRLGRSRRRKAEIDRPGDEYRRLMGEVTPGNPSRAGRAGPGRRGARPAVRGPGLVDDPGPPGPRRRRGPASIARRDRPRPGPAPTRPGRTLADADPAAGPLDGPGRRVGRSARAARSRASATTPRRPASGSPTRTTGPRSAGSPRRWAGASA